MALAPFKLSTSIPLLERLTNLMRGLGCEMKSKLWARLDSPLAPFREPATKRIQAQIQFGYDFACLLATIRYHFFGECVVKLTGGTFCSDGAKASFNLVHVLCIYSIIAGDIAWILFRVSSM